MKVYWSCTLLVGILFCLVQVSQGISVKKLAKKIVKEFTKPFQHKEERSVHTEDKPIEFYDSDVFHVSVSFDATNPEDFLKKLDMNGISTKDSKLLADTAFKVFAQYATDTTLWLPNSGTAFVQVLYLSSVRADTNSNLVHVKSVVITSTTKVKAETDFHHINKEKFLGNNRERKWTSTEVRELTSDEANKLYGFLMNNLINYQNLQLAKVNVEKLKQIPATSHEERIIV